MPKKHSLKHRFTEFVAGEGLKIPVFDKSLGEKGRYQAEPEVVRNSMLELIFSPEELNSLVIVKPDPENNSSDPLKDIDFGDGIPRKTAFSSGKNVYFADRELSTKLLNIFATQPDHACRYGSLLVSSCTQGTQLLDSAEDGKPIRIKIVDSQSDNPQEIAEAKRWQTGDCHGKISPLLAQQLGSSSNRPFQFRFAWMSDWEQENCHTPAISFLAKGTLLPDAELTDSKGYDIIMDRSSIKGIAKEQLAKLIPCGDCEFPKIAIGNRGNAKTTEYENSWQFSIWYSENAIAADISQPTKTEAKQLADLQNNPLKLARYLVKQYDRKAALMANNNEGDDRNTIEGEDHTPHESRLIKILRHDTLGQLLDFPKVADFMREQLAKKWKDLAIKGAVHHGSAMAQPCEDLKPGTIVAPHLRHGTEVIVTRYPIVSKDNIRRYTADNKSHPELMQYKGCAFIRPDQAMQHHQCDFDGDQLVITPASRMPNIAKETRHANEENEYDAVEKREKVDYTKALDRDGNRKYTKLRQIAAAIAQNKIGWVATLIGRVQSSVPESEQPESLFDRNKRKLLGQLFDALQIEVDTPKSAARLEDHHPTLLEKAKKWSETYPCHLFDYKDEPRLYKTVPLPTEDGTAISCIAREAVNPEWEPTRIKSRHRDEFRYLFDPPSDLDEREKWEKYYVSWAQDVKERYRERMGEIYTSYSDNIKAFKEAVGKLYESLRADVAEAFVEPEERFLAASAMWHVETANPNLEGPRKACKELSKQLKIEFNLESNYQRLHEALPKDTYILSVPFEEFAVGDGGSIKRDSKRRFVGKDLAGEWKEKLDSKGIKYEATLHSSLPAVNFALIEPSDKLIAVLESKFGGNVNDIDSLDLTYRDGLGRTKNISDRIVAPADYNWIESADSTPKAALVLNLFADEICQQLQTFQFKKAELIGQKYNDYKDVDFSDPQWQGKKMTFEVGALSSSAGDRRDGSPIVTLDGKQLAMFSASSPKLPIGTTFEATIEPSPKGSALTLNIDPESVKLIEPVIALSESPEVAKPSFFQKRFKVSDDLSLDTAKPPEAESLISQEQVRSHNSQKPPEAESLISQGQVRSHNSQKPLSRGEISADSASLSQLMKDAISEVYQRTGEVQFNVGLWTAFVSNRTSRCLVRDESENPVFAVDLKTGRVIKELSQENSALFLEQVLKAAAESTPQLPEKRLAESQL
ncbi:MAG: hypothetical protein MUE44_28805 [Oscillatoriaceae cyanobacterium Prado104]|jgi:hypothetical protein|nr:hypothetical protein [Oscillatoriaceae cyanobacterium Prado104]